MHQSSLPSINVQTHTYILYNEMYRVLNLLCNCELYTQVRKYAYVFVKILCCQNDESYYYIV